MSNIYYNDRSLITTQSNNNFQLYNQIEINILEKILGLDICGVSLANTNKTALDSFSWRAKDIFYLHKEYGEVYIPKNIALKNENHKYYIVLIDNSIEVVRWDSELTMTDNRTEKLKKSLITSEHELQKIISGFLQLVDYLGVTKPILERFAHIKGNRIKQPSIDALINHILEPGELATKISESVYQSAIAPVKYFDGNQAFMKSLNIDEPTRDLYKTILCELLEQNDYLFTLDWKFTPEDLQYAIDTLSKGICNIPLLDEAKVNHNTQKIFAIANQLCQQKGFRLMNIDLDSDNFNIILLPLNQCADVSYYAKECRLKITEIEK